MNVASGSFLLLPALFLFPPSFFFLRGGHWWWWYLLFSPFWYFSSIEVEMETRVSSFSMQNSKQFPVLISYPYVPPSCRHWCLQNLSFSGFLTCKMAHFLALSSLPALKFESSLLCKVFPIPLFPSLFTLLFLLEISSSLIKQRHCLSTSFSLGGLRDHFQEKGPQTCLLCRLESKNTQDPFRMSFYFPGGTSSHSESLVKKTEFKARKGPLHVFFYINGCRRNLEKLNPIEEFSQMQKMGKWSIWIIESPVW